MFRVALAALAAVIVAGHGAALAASADKGKAAFMKYGCWQCHGTQGQGSSWSCH
jgi:cytochrome c551/c552